MFPGPDTGLWRHRCTPTGPGQWALRSERLHATVAWRATSEPRLLQKRRGWPSTSVQLERSRSPPLRSAPAKAGKRGGWTPPRSLRRRARTPQPLPAHRPQRQCLSKSRPPSPCCRRKAGQTNKRQRLVSRIGSRCGHRCAHPSLRFVWRRIRDRRRNSALPAKPPPHPMPSRPQSRRPRQRQTPFCAIGARCPSKKMLGRPFRAGLLQAPTRPELWPSGHPRSSPPCQDAPPASRCQARPSVRSSDGASIA